MPMEIARTSTASASLPLALGLPIAPVIASSGVRFKTGRTKAGRAHLPVTELLNKPWFIGAAAGEALLADYFLGHASDWYDADDDDDEDDPNKDCPYGMTDDGMACMLIAGALSSERYWSTTAYSEIAAMHAHALANPNVKGICVCFSSPGGTASSELFDLADAMYAARDIKPCVALSCDAMYSAAYLLGSSAASKLFVTRLGGVGSVGVWTSYTNIEKMLENFGVQVKLIYSGARKVDGSPLMPLSAKAQEDMQAEVDRVRGLFVDAVARGRNTSVDSIYGTEAAIMMAGAACPMLADMVGSIDDALTCLRGMCATRQLEEPGSKEDYPLQDDGTGAVPPAAQSPTSASIAHRALLLGTLNLGAIPYSKTATTDEAWDAGANEKSLKDGQSASYYRKMYAWVDGSTDGTKKSNYKFPHHMVSADGTIGAANIKACESAIAALNGARTPTTIPAGDKKGVYAHVSGHLKAAGKDPAPLKSEAQLTAEDAPFPFCVEDADGARHLYSIREADASWSESVGSTSFDYAHRMALLNGLRLLKTEHPEAFAAVRNVRAASNSTESRKITILAAPYNSTANLGQFDERYRPGCFDNGGLSGDLRVLARHAESQNFVLGRVSSGTARFWTDKDGVHAEATAPDTTWANDLLVSMARGDVSDASAAFYILKASYEVDASTGRKIRWIERALLVDAGVEAFGAYPGATAYIAEQPQSSQASVQVTGKPIKEPQTSEIDQNGINRARLDLLRLYELN